MTLGDDTRLITRLGTDELGERTLKRIRDLELPIDHIQMDPHHPTGTVDVYLDENKNPDYTINENVAYDHIHLTEDLIELVEGADSLCFGTVVQRSERSRETFRSLVDRFRGEYIFYDINIRKNCYTEDIIRKSLEISTILKLNEEELSFLADMFSLSREGIRGRTEELLGKFGLEHCVVTLGDRGIYARSGDNEAYAPSYAVELVDPVGAGDACAAGFMDCLVRGRDLEYTCRFANALGALVAAQQGATGEVPRDRITTFMDEGDIRSPHPEFTG
jgi:fructokinase